VEDHSAPRTGRRTLTVVAGLVVAVLAIAAVGVVVLWPSREPVAVAAPAPKPPRASTPFEQATAVLDAQVTALLKGDEKGWLAPVDPARPKLVARYRSLYRNLRGLDVRQAEFHARPMDFWTMRDKAGMVTVDATLGYCFSDVACPTWRTDAQDGPPKVVHRLTFQLIKGEYLITARAAAPGTRKYLTPVPWDGDGLALARGRRVTVIAAHSQAKRVKEVLAAAEKAAAAVDRFAGYMGNRQTRYRVYLADEKAWKTWYGGQRAKWAIGYELPLNATGADVVLRARDVLKSRRQLASTVQHEFGHVVTLAGIVHRETADDQWLLEGIAEYIGEYPRAATATGYRDVLASEFRRSGAPRTIATRSLDYDAADREVHRLYGMGLFAGSCMADRYGERRLFDFVDRVLRKGEKPDPAARAAYGKPFATVDRTCLKWIKRKVR
jgi:hypothetical protein